jgi:hypothetical protein
MRKKTKTYQEAAVITQHSQQQQRLDLLLSIDKLEQLANGFHNKPAHQKADHKPL